ncbi:unnamed protein product, partial [Rotaria sp. Silwood1]
MTSQNGGNVASQPGSPSTEQTSPCLPLLYWIFFDQLLDFMAKLIYLACD